MPRDGSGNYSLPEAPFQNDTVADPTVMNSQLSDLASALTASLVKDGQTAATADLPMGTNKHTNVGNAAARNQYAAAGQVQDDSLKNLGSVAGTNTITGSLTPAITAYATGMLILFRPAGGNTGATTIAVNGLAAKSIVKFGSTALASGDLVTGVPALIIYDGTNFLLLNPQTNVAADLVTNAMLANMAQATVKGRASGAGTGDPTDLTAAQLITILLGADGAGSLLDADLLDGQHAAAFAAASHAHAIGDLTDFAAGTYTPTDSDLTNLSACTPGTFMYIRISSIVFLIGWVTLDPVTASTTAADSSNLTSFSLDLPVASNFSSSANAAGIMIGRTAGDAYPEFATISADTVNDVISVGFYARNSVSHTVTVIAAYRVI